MSIASHQSRSGEFSRENPSPRYRELLKQYQTMHREGIAELKLPPEETFTGHSLLHQVERILALIRFTGSKSILDYGSGKGIQYQLPLHAPNGNSWESIQNYWSVDEIRCYDPAVPGFDCFPNRQFDGVICTDVLEHCPVDDVPWIIEELFACSSRFVYANVACYPAKKQLPNGENAHCTVEPNEWWKSIIHPIARNYPTLKFEFCFTSVIQDEQESRHEERFGNAHKAA